MNFQQANTSFCIPWDLGFHNFARDYSKCSVESNTGFPLSCIKMKNTVYEIHTRDEYVQISKGKYMEPNDAINHNSTINKGKIKHATSISLKVDKQ